MNTAEEAGVLEVGSVPPLRHQEAMGLAENEFGRMVDLVGKLNAEDWKRPTVCELWNVQATVAHVLGMAEAQASVRQFGHDFRAAARRSDGAMIDALTATQVRERAALTPAQLVDGLARVAPRAVRARRRIPAPVRWAVRMKQDPPFEAERWKFGYLVDRIFTRDTWMHRLDVCRATGHEMTLSTGHDGRLVADVVADWAHRHGKSFVLTLTGTAGGHWQAGSGGEAIEVDALDFCWTLAGRTSGAGLLATPVPF